jgi:hypothetical protein
MPIEVSVAKMVIPMGGVVVMGRSLRKWTARVADRARD